MTPASAHVEMATQNARASGDPWTIGAAATAQAFLAMARGDLEDVIGAAGSCVPRIACSRQGWCAASTGDPWRSTP